MKNIMHFRDRGCVRALRHCLSTPLDRDTDRQTNRPRTVTSIPID